MDLTNEQLKFADELAETSVTGHVKSSLDLHPAVMGALLGGGLGGLSGFATNHPNRNVVRNALLGALLGGGMGMLPHAAEQTKQKMEEAKTQFKETPKDVKAVQRAGGAVAGAGAGALYSGIRDAADWNKKVFTPASAGADPASPLSEVATKYLPSKEQLNAMAQQIKSQINPATMNIDTVSKHELLYKAMANLAERGINPLPLAAAMQSKLVDLQTPVGSGMGVASTRSINPLRLLLRQQFGIPYAEKSLMNTARRSVDNLVQRELADLREKAVASVANATPKQLASKLKAVQLRHSNLTPEQLGGFASEQLPKLLSTHGPQRLPSSKGILHEASGRVAHMYEPRKPNVMTGLGTRAAAGAGAGALFGPTIFSLLGLNDPATPNVLPGAQ